ncbi:MAG: sensor histidine kinase [Mycobacterium sp.]
MLRPASRYVRDRLRRRGELIPLGFTWAFVITVDVAMVLIAAVSIVQRPSTDLLPALGGSLIAVSPLVLFFVSGVKFNPGLVAVSSWTATAIFLFATSTPIAFDFAPLLLVLMLGCVGSLASLAGGLLAAAAAAALLVAAATAHRLDGVALYLSFVAMGWLVGFLMRTQQQLMIRQDQMQADLAEHAAADERRRIAREVHDVIAHSLSVTLLHVTGARRGLQEDRDIDDAVDALQDAERLGRQAMADIRRTVGLLDDGRVRIAPEPGIADIPCLINDFVEAGLVVNLRTEGAPERVSSGVGLAVYRITQESLANIAKHAPQSPAEVTLLISPTTARLTVVSQLPDVPSVGGGSEGRGLRGIRQRVELLSGAIDIGAANDEWAVCAEIPLAPDGLRLQSWSCGR